MDCLARLIHSIPPSTTPLHLRQHFFQCLVHDATSKHRLTLYEAPLHISMIFACMCQVSQIQHSLTFRVLHVPYIHVLMAAAASLVLRTADAIPWVCS